MSEGYKPVKNLYRDYKNVMLKEDVKHRLENLMIAFCGENPGRVQAQPPGCIVSPSVMYEM